MKLSVAMMLGSTTCKMEAGNWNSCALGCAGNAVGIPQMLDIYGDNDCRRFRSLARRWPWLGSVPDEDADPVLPSIFAVDIWGKFDRDVCEGKMTFEELVDYVRSIEPSCGECNSHNCTCPVQKMDELNAPQTETITVACL